MRRDNLLASTPFRLAVIFAAMFVGAFLLTGVVVYQLMKWELLQQQDRTTAETYAVIADAYGQSDLTDLLDAVRTNVQATPSRERVFLVASPQGKVLAGNMKPVDLPAGWSDISGRQIGADPEQQYRVFSGAVDGNRLVVGISHEQIDSLEEIVLVSFAWASVAVAFFAVSGGAIIGLRARRRFDRVRETMERVSHGDLAARIPLLGEGDDIDLLSRDINDALTRLAATVEGMRQVSADIAHDLKTPLNRLKITIEDALKRREQGFDAGEDLELAAAEADQINQTFEALLRIAQIEAGARKARFAEVDLGDVLTSLAEVYADVAEDAGQTLALEPAAAAPCIISGDRELLTQMYANLIENAIRHCPPGAHVLLRMRTEDGVIVTAVEDDGPGIPEEEQERVFRRLYRLEKSRTSPGTGLGLSLVKAIADLHDASIRTVDANPGLRISIVFGRGSAGT